MRRTVDARFWAKVLGGNVETCWLWTAHVLDTGYGQFRDEHGRLVRAHRWSYEQLRAEIPDGLVLDHTCRNRRCVNPWHLDPVTSRTNTLRGEGTAARNATKKRCLHGHAFTPENTYVRPNGWRECRACRRGEGAELIEVIAA
ncbi:HNH endonuclease [Streptomyces sp. NPDC088732]|uniref:HNH endonuclease n=1 Tax=Streptomyces sp. NPDC088732 TaxID=3365879 RepID=UPI003811C338